MLKLAAILMGIVVFVTLFTLFAMYRFSLSVESDHLREMVQSQARLMEEGFRFDRQHFTQHGKKSEEAFGYTLERLREAHKNYEGFGESGEYTLARREGGMIHFLLTHRHDSIKTEDKIIPIQKGIAEPMQQALEGKSGVIIGRDYRGTRVIAAYEPLHVNERMGIVAKIDLSEVENPFIYTGLSVIGISLLLVMGGVLLIFRVIDPLLGRLQKSESHHKTLLRTIPEIITEVDRDKRITWLNPAGEEFFGGNVIGEEACTFFVGEQRTYAAVDRVFQGKEEMAYVESLQRRQDGAERLLAWYCGGLHDEHGQITGVLSTARDITESRASYTRLKKVNRLLRIISECNQILVRSTGVERLLNEIVDLMHEEGDYISVFVAAEEEGSARVLAAVGTCDKEGLTEYLNNPKSNISIKTATESLRFYIGRGEDLAELNRYCPQSNVEADYSFGLFPFEMDEVPVVLVLCSDKPEVFSDEEIHLIEELTGDLTYGIRALRNLEKKKSNEQHLRTLNLRYKMASEVSGSAAWEIWPQTEHIFGDDGLKRLLGYLPEDLGVDFAEWLAIMHPSDREKVEAIIEKMAKGEMGQHTVEIRFVQKDGSYRWFLASGSRIDMEGDEWHIYGAVTDITALKDAQLRFEELFDNMSSGMAIYRAVDGGEDFVFVDMNRAGERISHVKKEEILGRKLSEVFPAVETVGLLNGLRRVNRSGKAEFLPEFYYQDERISQWVDNRIYRLDSGEVVALYDDTTELVEKSKAERIFSELIDQSRDAIFLVNDSGGFENVNEEACRSLGYTKAELLKMEIPDIMPNDMDNLPTFLSIFEKVRAGGSIVFETVHRRKNRETFPVEISVRYMMIEGRGLMIAIARDISERKSAEIALTESEARYHTLFDNIQEGVIIVDTSGEIRFVNNIAHDIFEMDKMVGTQLDLPLAELENNEKEIALPLKNGNSRHILAKALEIEWKSEKLFQVTLHDITALHNAYAELERKNEQFYNTIEYAPIPIMLLAEDGEVLRLNRVWTSMTGYTKTAIPTVDAWVRQAFDAESAGKKRQQIMERFSQEGPVSEGECIITTADGHKLNWFFTSAPLGELQDGRKVAITTALDVTELHEKEEQMITQSRQAAMGDMIAMIAHQWRQPITVIAMAVNNIKLDIELDEVVTTEKIEGMIETVTEQTQHLSKTIDDFRDFFKPNKEKAEFSVYSVVESALKIIGKSLENNNITVTSSDKSTRTVKTYPNELLQVLLNLISNAKDAHKNDNRDDAFIHIEITNDEEEVCLSICDNAGGIPQEALTRIGQPYFTTKKENGTGLGLYMSQTIIQKHMHGKLTWANKGEGACFNIILPISEEES